MNFEFPNTQSWNFAGEPSADGSTITGVISTSGRITLESEAVEIFSASRNADVHIPHGAR